MRASRGWIFTILIITVLSFTLLAPTFLGDSVPAWWGKLFPDRGIRLGLDLKGGIFLLIGVDSEEGVKQELASIKDFMNEELKDDKVLIKGSSASGETLTLQFFSKSDLDKAKPVADDAFGDISDIEEDNLSLEFILKSAYVADVEERAIDQVKQVIENRVAELGLVEPSIQKAGDNRILIQVPGASEKDRQRIIDIIKRSAVLEFKIVSGAGATEETVLAGLGM